MVANPARGLPFSATASTQIPSTAIVSVPSFSGMNAKANPMAFTADFSAAEGK